MKYLMITIGLILFSQSLLAQENLTSKLLILFPQTENKSITKQVFHVDAYQSLACPLKEKFNPDHPDYLGELVHIEAKKFKPNKKLLSIKTDKPLMLSAFYSTIRSKDQSNICYYQSQAFWPQSHRMYQIEFKENCEVDGYEILTSGEKNKIKLNSTIDSCY